MFLKGFSQHFPLFNKSLKNRWKSLKILCLGLYDFDIKLPVLILKRSEVFKDASPKHEFGVFFTARKQFLKQ